MIHLLGLTYMDKARRYFIDKMLMQKIDKRELAGQNSQQQVYKIKRGSTVECAVVARGISNT